MLGQSSIASSGVRTDNYKPQHPRPFLLLAGDRTGIMNNIIDEDDDSFTTDYIGIQSIESSMPEKYDLYWNSFLPVFFDRISMVIKKTMTEAVKDYGITSAHSIYLIALNLQDGQTLMELSRFLDLDPANTNRVIKVLKEKELVYDDRKSQRSKKYRIFITDLGKEAAKKSMDATNKVLNDPMNQVSEEELLQVRTTLIKVLNAIDPDLDEYMASKWTHPFYTYLHFIPPEDEAKFKIYPSTDGIYKGDKEGQSPPMTVEKDINL